MKLKKMKIGDIVLNEHNPRDITEENYTKLKKSIQEFPEMLETRPLVIDEKNVVIGGNMRLRALKELGYTEIPVHQVTGWTEEQKKEFVIKDNVSFGSWDWEVLANNWDVPELRDWGVWVPDIGAEPDEDVDYGILEGEGIEGEVEAMTHQIKKAILIEFSLAGYEEAFEIIKNLRAEGKDVGAIVLEALRKTK